MLVYVSVDLRRKQDAMEDERRGVRIQARHVVLKATPKRDRARCGARTRAGGECAAPVVEGRNRCRLHGGLSTGPKSEAGREAVKAANRRRAAERKERRRLPAPSCEAVKAAR